MTFKQTETLFATARGNSKFLERNTRLYKRFQTYVIRFWEVDIVTITHDGCFKLNTAGWRTATTKSRLNKYTPAHITQKNFEWYIGNVVFEDGMIVKDNGA